MIEFVKRKSMKIRPSSCSTDFISPMFLYKSIKIEICQQ